MDIKYLGHSSFRIRGKSAAVVTDPFDKSTVGLSFPPITSDIVTVSHEHQDHNAVDAIKPRDEKSTVMVLRGPGEYEIQGVKIFGIHTFHDKEQGKERGVNTMYRIEIDGMSILHCGDLGHVLSDDQLEEVGTVEVLMIPTGGHFTINEKEAAKVVSQIEPSIVIPMHYKAPGLASSFDMLSPVDAFLSEMEKEPLREQKLVLTREKIPLETTVVVMSV